MAERFADRELDRMVVSCIGMCTPAGGKFRIDAVFAAGDPENVGAGAYGEFSGDCVAQ